MISRDVEIFIYIPLLGPCMDFFIEVQKKEFHRRGFFIQFYVLHHKIALERKESRTQVEIG